SRALGLGGAVLDVSPAILELDGDRLPAVRRVARSALLECALVTVETDGVGAGTRELAARFGAVGVPLVIATAGTDAGGFELVSVGGAATSRGQRTVADLVETIEPTASLD